MTPGHLKSISYTMNTSKSNKSRDSWTPYTYKSAHLRTPESREITMDDCIYVADWLAVKYRYNLSLTQEEYTEIEKILNDPSSKCYKLNIYPSEPIYSNDDKGFYIDIANSHPNVVMSPILNNNDYNTRKLLRIKWLDIDRNMALTTLQKLGMLWQDFSSNFQLYYENRYKSLLSQEDIASYYKDLFSIVTSSI